MFFRVILTDCECVSESASTLILSMSWDVVFGLSVYVVEWLMLFSLNVVLGCCKCWMEIICLVVIMVIRESYAVACIIVCVCIGRLLDLDEIIVVSLSDLGEIEIMCFVVWGGRWIGCVCLKICAGVWLKLMICVSIAFRWLLFFNVLIFMVFLYVR